jgi:hypothetical protein
MPVQGAIRVPHSTSVDPGGVSTSTKKYRSCTLQTTDVAKIDARLSVKLGRRDLYRPANHEQRGCQINPRLSIIHLSWAKRESNTRQITDLSQDKLR